ncbi:MAG: hypothetical protein SOW59_09725 [Corynebacterium sp.]|nr:hypothetical protein [Corynebacterium sp.]
MEARYGPLICAQQVLGSSASRFKAVLTGFQFLLTIPPVQVRNKNAEQGDDWPNELHPIFTVFSRAVGELVRGGQPTDE